MATEELPRYRRLTLEPVGDGSFVAQYQWTKYRFLMSDGSCVDIVAVRDDSDLRGAVLELHYGKKVTDPKQGSIAGVATIPMDPEPDPEPAPPPVRRTRTKKS